MMRTNGNELSPCQMKGIQEYAATAMGRLTSIWDDCRKGCLRTDTLMKRVTAVGDCLEEIKALTDEKENGK